MRKANIVGSILKVLMFSFPFLLWPMTVTRVEVLRFEDREIQASTRSSKKKNKKRWERSSS